VVRADATEFLFRVYCVGCVIDDTRKRYLNIKLQRQDLSGRHNKVRKKKTHT